MQENSFWNLIIKSASAFAAAFLILGAALVAAAHFGWTNNATGTVTVFFASLLAIFALAAVNLYNAALRRQAKSAVAAAQKLAAGETLSAGDLEISGDLSCLLKDISDNLTEKARLTERIAAGDFSADAVLQSEADELGKAFQKMIERLRFYIQTQQTRDALQRSVARLSEEVAELAAGDLTVRAEVSNDLTGAVAEAFNSMTGELRSLIKQVKDTTYQVGSSAGAISDTTEQLARGSEAQSLQIADATEAIARMARQIQKVSENAALSAQVAGEALANAQSGSKAVHDNIGAMNSIRRQVRETAKRVKKLGERSQEIGQIVQLIDDLSDRTGLLALNASLQASAAGEQERGFAVVAEEVERLAVRSTRLTEQIAALTRAMQAETKDVVASIEETVHEVVVGSALADKAGRALVEIEQVSTRLAALLGSISESAAQQAAGAEDVSATMRNISKITELVQDGSRRAAESVKLLVDLSDDLRDAVAPFRLPEDRNAERRTAARMPENFLN